MHEHSLARAVLHEVQAVAAQRQLGRIAAVTVDVGEFSGVEPVLLQSALIELSEPSLGIVEFRLHVVPLEAECLSCHAAFRVMDFRFRCPRCDSDNVQIVRGEELTLQSVTAELGEAR